MVTHAPRPTETAAVGTPAAPPKPRRARRTTPKPLALGMTYPDACGIDIGSTSHFVAVPADRVDPQQPCVREFPAFTADLHRLLQWLRECRITAVAMESTGVYWIPLYEMLEAA